MKVRAAALILDELQLLAKDGVEVCYLPKVQCYSLFEATCRSGIQLIYFEDLNELRLACRADGFRSDQRCLMLIHYFGIFCDLGDLGDLRLNFRRIIHDCCHSVMLLNKIPAGDLFVFAPYKEHLPFPAFSTNFEVVEEDDVGKIPRDLRRVYNSVKVALGYRPLYWDQRLSPSPVCWQRAMTRRIDTYPRRMALDAYLNGHSHEIAIERSLKVLGRIDRSLDEFRQVTGSRGKILNLDLAGRPKCLWAVWLEFESDQWSRDIALHFFHTRLTRESFVWPQVSHDIDEYFPHRIGVLI